MQKVSKVGVDLLFCSIVGFIVIQATSSAQYNPELNDRLSAESGRISADRMR